MFNKIILSISLLCLALSSTISQDCSITIQGKVVDHYSGEPLSYVNVLVQEQGIGDATEEDGIYKISGVCEGEVHLIASHIACESVVIPVHIHNDTTITVQLKHTEFDIGTVTIEGSSESEHRHIATHINSKQIEDNVSNTLSDILELQTGVSAIKSGSGISKPIIHGLYGNRLTIINNGVEQSGQQWGIDHSPEIDPSSAKNITIIKGASALEYGGNVGGVIIVEPEKIGREPHLHGGVNYAYESNGRGSTAHVNLKKYHPILSWAINGTYRNYGDRNAPDYFLRNTGARENNASIQLEKSWDDKAFANVYFSSYNASLGILRGSHIGNLTDLEEALSRSEPFFTESSFKRSIDPPRQEVSHHLLKAKYQRYYSPDESLTLSLSAQRNNRKEYDVRRSGRSEIPALSLKQNTYSLQAGYKNTFGQGWELSSGIQSDYVDNENNPETGILPLIPDYSQVNSSLYAIINREVKDSRYYAGVRYTFKFQNVATISQSKPRKIIRYENSFHNYHLTAGYAHRLSKFHSLEGNISYGQRNPAINELYSYGLHQGVSGIEEGDVNLQKEKSLKSTLTFRWNQGSRFTMETDVYYQRFADYIYLNPENELELTIRGAFPLFRYRQSDAEIYGLDASMRYTLFKDALYGSLKYSYLRGNNLSDGLPLVYMPQNNGAASLTYRLKNEMTIGSLKMNDTEIEWKHEYFFKQNHLEESQDFLSPPDAYYLMGIQLSSNIIWPKYSIRFIVKADNLLDASYRNYLNRHRYFADDIGRSITVGVNLKF